VGRDQTDPGEGCSGASRRCSSASPTSHRQRVHDPDPTVGPPEWLHLVVLWGLWNAFKFVLNGPVSLFRLVRAVMREQMMAQAVRPKDRVRVSTNSRC